MHFEKPDFMDVMDMANFYRISEFDLFRLSYIWWYGRFPDEQKIEGEFIDYLFEGRIPSYVRQFLRENPLLDDNGSTVEEWVPY